MILKIHPVANMLPGLNPEELETLREGIRRDGQLVPILAIDDQIIDGRHRYWACQELGIEPKVQQWDGPRDMRVLIDVAMGLNIRRRHLTPSQRAALAANALPMFEAEARERMMRGKAPDPEEQIAQGASRSIAASLFNVNHRYVNWASSIKEWDEVTFNAVLNGDLTLKDAGRIMRKQMQQAEEENLSADEKPLRVPNPPMKWEADVKYDVWAGGVHIKTLHFSSDTLQWDQTTHEA